MSSEKSIERRIKKALEERGWLVFKIHGGPMQHLGLPDLWCIWKGFLMCLEVKKPGGKISKVQHIMSEILASHGVVVVFVTEVAEAEYAAKGCEAVLQ